MIIDIDEKVVLPILLKELDHLQAIVGRYDTFFFLMKQIAIATIGATVGAYLTKRFDGIGYIILVPLLFLISEYSFRVAYWADFIGRVLEVESYFRAPTNANFVLYSLNAKLPFRSRATMAFKLYDLLFYSALALIAWWLVTYFQRHYPR